MATWFDEPAEMPTATASAPSLHGVLHGGDGGVVGRVELDGEHRGLEDPRQRRAVAAEQRTGQALGDGDGVRLAFGDAGEGGADGGQPGGDATGHGLVERHGDGAAVGAEKPAQAQVSAECRRWFRSG